MIKFKLKQLIAEREFEQGKRILFTEIADKTGIHRATLSRIANNRGYNTTSDNLNALCKFFSCSLSDIAEYVEEEED